MNAPRVRVVKVRLSGEGDDVGAVAELLARLLPPPVGGPVPGRRDLPGLPQPPQ